MNVNVITGLVGVFLGAACAFGSDGSGAGHSGGDIVALTPDEMESVCPKRLTANEISVLQGDIKSFSNENNLSFQTSLSVKRLKEAGLLPKDVHDTMGGALLEFERDPKTSGKIIGGRGYTWSDIEKGKTQVKLSHATLENGKLACKYSYKRAYLGGDASFKIYLAGKDRNAQ